MPVPFFLCDHCQTRYQYDAALVGQAISCTECGHVFEVPAQATVELTGSAPRGTGRWFLRFANGRQFGPVVREAVEEWLTEGRANAESWICEEGTEDWKQLKDAFPELVQQISAEPEDPYAAEPLAVTSLSGVGLLEFWPDEFEFLSPREQQEHIKATEWLEEEIERSGGVVKMCGRRSVRIGEKVVFGESSRLPEEARPESLTVIAMANQGAEIYLVIPWSKLGRLPHEFVSIIPGRLPSAVALRRRGEDTFDGGRWLGISGTENDVLAVAARRKQEELAGQIEWEWFSEAGDFTMTLVWGVQVVPLGDEKFIHLMQTAMLGKDRRDSGVIWYLKRQQAFYQFSKRLSIPQDHETYFLFSTSAGQLFTNLSDLRDTQSRLKEGTQT